MSITKTNETYNPETRSYDKTVEVFAVGATLKVWNEAVRVMSDVWEDALHASYWDDNEQRVKTAVWVQPGSSPDATPAVMEKVFQRTYRDELTQVLYAMERKAAEPVRGSRVKVVAGKTEKGKSGSIQVIIERPYNMGNRSELRKKYGIATSDRKEWVVAKNGKSYENYLDMIWVWAKNCELASSPEIDINEARESALYRANALMREKYTRDWRQKNANEIKGVAGGVPA